MTSTVAFDVYGTLIDPLGISNKLKDYVGDNAVRFAQIWRDKQIEYLFRRGLMREYQDFSTCTRHALEFTNSHLSTNLSSAAFDALMAKYRELPAYTDVASALQQLNAHGHRNFAFSNGHPDDLENLLVHAGLKTYLDGIVSVHDVASFKPDPLVYRHFLDNAKSMAGYTWLVSGNPFDVIGAAAVGWNTAWVKRDPSAVFDPWGFEPTITIADLSELPAALGNR